MIAAPVFELLPLEDVYPPYLAAHKESWIGVIELWDPDARWLWDITRGGRAGLFRVVLASMTLQADLEGAAFVRLDLDDNRNLLSSEFRYGTISSSCSPRLRNVAIQVRRILKEPACSFAVLSNDAQEL